MGYKTDMVGSQDEVHHVRWASSHSVGIHSWTNCLRKEVSRMLAYLFCWENPVFQNLECKEKLQEDLCANRERMRD